MLLQRSNHLYLKKKPQYFSRNPSINLLHQFIGKASSSANLVHWRRDRDRFRNWEDNNYQSLSDRGIIATVMDHKKRLNTTRRKRIREMSIWCQLIRKVNVWKLSQPTKSLILLSLTKPVLGIISPCYHSRIPHLLNTHHQILIQITEELIDRRKGSPLFQNHYLNFSKKSYASVVSKIPLKPMLGLYRRIYPNLRCAFIWTH